MERIARLIRELDMEAATPAEVRDTFGYRGRVPSGPSSRRDKTSATPLSRRPSTTVSSRHGSRIAGRSGQPEIQGA
jgi:hypothetical protein